MKSLSVTNQIKATKHYFPVILFIMLYKMVLTFEFVDGILKCDHSSESYREVFLSFLWCCILCCKRLFEL